MKDIILFGVPFGRESCTQMFALACCETIWPMPHVKCWTTGWATTGACNRMAHEALTNEFKWTLIAANDVGWEPMAIQKLMRHDKDIVGGWGLGRMHPHVSHTADAFDPKTGLFRRAPVREHGLQKVAAFGGGLWLIKTEVFKRIPYPWFEWTELPIGVWTRTEDYAFSHKAQAYGFDIYVDWDVNVPHLATGYYTKGKRVYMR